MSNTLKLLNVSKHFNTKERFEVLENINISAKEGEFVCIIGPSGCGKTILLYLIAGFLRATAGEILIDGNPVKKPNIDRVLVFQNYVLFPWKTIYKNVLFGLENSKMSRKQKDVLVRQCLDLVGLSQFSDWFPNKLSGGMQQRIAIARAFIVNPRILLMDEPFSALDSQNRKYLRRNLQEIWEKTRKTVIFVTHSVSEAIYLADKIYVLSARPAKVIDTFEINLPRQRNKSSPEYIGLVKKIESHIYDEFLKSMNFQSATKTVNSLLEFNL